MENWIKFASYSNVAPKFDYNFAATLKMRLGERRGIFYMHSLIFLPEDKATFNI